MDVTVEQAPASTSEPRGARAGGARTQDAKRIVIVGGGAAGLELAIRLARSTRASGRARITLVDASADHLWKPRLHEIAAGLLRPSEEEANFAVQACLHGFDFELGTVTSLDADKGAMTLAAISCGEKEPLGAALNGQLLPERTLGFDIAVLAMGGMVNDFGTPGVEAHCYTLDSPRRAERLHHALLAVGARVKAGVQPKLKVAIVGGGTTGVELAAELRDASRRLPLYVSLLQPHQFEVTLLEMADRLIPHATEQMSSYAKSMLRAADVETRFGAKVTGVDAKGLSVEGGERVEADVVVWASGVKARALAELKPAAKFAKTGHIVVDRALRVLRASDGAPVPGLYALGDTAAAPRGGADGVTPATAQAAHQQAAMLARSIVRQLHGRPPLEFAYKDKGTIVSLGGASAVGEAKLSKGGGGLQFSGFSAKLAYAWLYQAHQAALFGPVRAATRALGDALRRPARPASKLYW